MIIADDLRRKAFSFLCSFLPPLKAVTTFATLQNWMLDCTFSQHLFDTKMVQNWLYTANV